MEKTRKYSLACAITRHCFLELFHHFLFKADRAFDRLQLGDAHRWRISIFRKAFFCHSVSIRATFWQTSGGVHIRDFPLVHRRNPGVKSCNARVEAPPCLEHTNDIIPKRHCHRFTIPVLVYRTTYEQKHIHRHHQHYIHMICSCRNR